MSAFSAKHIKDIILLVDFQIIDRYETKFFFEISIDWFFCL